MATNVQALTSDEQIRLSQEKKRKHEGSLRTRRLVSNIIIYIILAVMCVIWLLPVVWLVLQSFNVEPGSAGLTRIIPIEWGLYNYQYLFTNVYWDVQIGEMPSAYVFFLKVGENGVVIGSFFYTLIIAIFSSLISTLFVMATSYAFSRLRFKSRRAMMRIILLLGMFPGFLGLIVLYQLFKIMGLLNTIWSLIIVYSGGAGMGYYISKGFFDTISKQIDEAAMIDGATKFQIFYKITMPLSKPIIVYQILTSFMGPWAEFITSSYILGGAQNATTGNPTTVAVQLQDMLRITDGTRGKYWGQFCAGAIVVAIPTSILFLIMQKNYVGGVTGGAVKG
ncbi:MAG: sugar ABC transporter permease [Bacilli bacterium]|nr:sugar ABC transporter permease [Bacilli bacterium]